MAIHYNYISLETLVMDCNLQVKINIKDLAGQVLACIFSMFWKILQLFLGGESFKNNLSIFVNFIKSVTDRRKTLLFMRHNLPIIELHSYINSWNQFRKSA